MMMGEKHRWRLAGWLRWLSGFDVEWISYIDAIQLLRLQKLVLLGK